MNKRIVKNLAVGACVLSVGVALAVVLRPATPHSATPSLASASALEMPQAAARLVSQAPAAQRSAVVRQVVQEVAARSSLGVTPFTISAICKATPELSAEAVAAAVAARPEETASIVRAALGAAPAQTEAVVAAACQELPQAYPAVAVAAAEENPSARSQILNAVATAIPVLAPQVQKAQLAYADKPMAVVIQKTHELAIADYNGIAGNVQPSPVSAQPTVGLQPMPAMAAAPGFAGMPYLPQNKGLTTPTVQAPPTIGPPLTPYAPGSTETKDSGTGGQLPPTDDRDYSGP